MKMEVVIKDVPVNYLALIAEALGGQASFLHQDVIVESNDWQDEDQCRAEVSRTLGDIGVPDYTLRVQARG